MRESKPVAEPGLGFMCRIFKTWDTENGRCEGFKRLHFVTYSTPVRYQMGLRWQRSKFCALSFLATKLTVEKEVMMS